MADGRQALHAAAVRDVAMNPVPLQTTGRTISTGLLCLVLALMGAHALDSHIATRTKPLARRPLRVEY
jgi:hypothetical protein